MLIITTWMVQQRDRRETGVNYYHVDGTAEGQDQDKCIELLACWGQ